MIGLRRYALGAAVLGFGVAERLRYERSTADCSTDSKNSAFVFIKPHANTSKTQKLVTDTFKTKGIKVIEEGELTGVEIDRDRLIDQHYYAIASKATLVKPDKMPVPANKFKEAFNITWEKALADGLVFNALDACTHLGITSDQLDAAWGPAKKGDILTHHNNLTYPYFLHS